MFHSIFFSTAEGSANGNSAGGTPTVTMRTRGGNAFVIQSMPSISDSVLPGGIRINSVEATILTPNDDLAAAFTGGSTYLTRITAKAYQI